MAPEKNQNMKKIAVALDGSKNSIRGLSKAIEIAKQDKSKILGLNIMELPQAYFVNKSKQELKEDLLKKSEKIMKSAAQKCKNAGVDFESKIHPGGDPGFDIVRYTKKYKVDTVVIGARGLNPVKELFLGSVSNYVLHKSKIPVLIVK